MIFFLPLSPEMLQHPSTDLGFLKGHTPSDLLSLLMQAQYRAAIVFG